METSPATHQRVRWDCDRGVLQRRVIRVISAMPLEGFQLRVRFTDGSERIIDVERFLRGPIFEAIRRDRSLFEAVSVDRALGVVTRPNGADIDPDVLYGLRKPAWAEAADGGSSS